MAKTILIVDDSATMLMSVRSTLEMGGFHVESAGDGLQALALIEKGVAPDLIVTDIHMPNMDGLSFIKAVRALPGFKFLPILTLTTESDPSKRERARELGATGWLVKPVNGPDFIAVIKQLLPGA